MTSTDTTTDEQTDADRVSLTTPTGTPTPLDTTPESILDYLEPMFANAYPSGTTLQYHVFELTHTTNGVWTVQHVEDSDPIDIVNINGFQTATALHAYLDDLAALNPDYREEWRIHRAARTGGDRR